jgi:hypothetical protein
MKLKYLLVINAVVDVIFGIGLILVPGTVLALFVPMPMYNLLGTQLLGANMIGFAVLNFFARNANEGNGLLRSILLANLASNLIGFVLSLIIQIGGTGTMMNWITVAITLVFVLGFGYFLLISFRPSPSLADARQ